MKMFLCMYGEDFANTKNKTMLLWLRRVDHNSYGHALLVLSSGFVAYNSSLNGSMTAQHSIDITTSTCSTHCESHDKRCSSEYCHEAMNRSSHRYTLNLLHESK